MAKRSKGMFGIKSQEHCGAFGLEFGHDLEYNPELKANESDECHGYADLCRGKDGSLYQVIKYNNYSEIAKALAIGELT